MVIQNTPTKIDKIASLRIGQRGENLATDIKMDVSDWITVHPDANYYCLFKRPDEVQVQPVLSSLEEDVLTWTVRAWECAVIGVGYLEVRAVNPDTGLVAKSRVIPCAIEDSVIDDEGPVPPEMSWVGEVLAAKDTAVAAKTAAEEARDTAQTTVNGAIAGIQAEGQTQVGVVQAEGTTQVGAVQSEGTTQVGAVQAKGTEVLNSIPSDYTALTGEVTDLKSALSECISFSPNLYNDKLDSVGSIKSDGTINTENTGWKHSDFIYIGSGHTFSSKAATSYNGTDGPTIVAYYDENKQFKTREEMTSNTGVFTHTMASGHAYIAFSMNKDTVPFMVNMGSTLLEYSGYGARVIETAEKLPVIFTKLGLTDYIPGIMSEMAEHETTIADISKKQVNKNLWNPIHITEGYYYNSSGGKSSNASYACVEDYWEVEASTNYCVSRFNPDKTYYGVSYCFICFYDENKNFLSWIEQGSAYFTTPATAKYIRYSANKNQFDGTYLIQIEKGTEHSKYVPYIGYAVEIKGTAIDEVLDIVKTNGLTPVVINVDVNGGGDYTSLRAAVEYAANFDASVIYIAPGTYDVASYYTSEEMTSSGFVGLKMPVNCQLIGTGDRDATIITMTLDTQNQLISTLNIQSNFTMKNVTVYGENTRYTIHDDFGYAFEDDHRLIENCKIKGKTLYYANAYGSGNTRNGAEWVFKDCIFEGDACPFSNHNGTGTVTKNNVLEFVNCQFINTNSVGNAGNALMFRSLSNAMGIHYSLVKLYGCYGNGKLILGEENASVYGAGIRFRVTGYADDFGEVVISHTDQADYSGNVDIR